ncbi:hypothetical protein GALMADRAFT_1181886 [Galerina marginata CBS 339.88]|uniref:Uncharacterized protein n=1 Tax=Galerina marginata (strain CBS 339.88) TaxID=685588 RepID=A0A067TMG2_GALM3|nr:hypothetical protein GALMADRAFT_1181886 [Galerina marginata CBS 339.88]
MQGILFLSSRCISGIPDAALSFYHVHQFISDSAHFLGIPVCTFPFLTGIISSIFQNVRPFIGQQMCPPVISLEEWQRQLTGCG